MKMKAYEKLSIEGFSTLRAWKKGFIGPLLARGYNLEEATRIVKSKGLLVFQNKKNNLIVSTGKGIVVTSLLGFSTTGLTYHAIGTGGSTPIPADVLLETEVNRGQWAVKNENGNIAEFSVFYTAAESTFNLKETGVFCEAATGVADTGTMFSRLLQAYDNSGGLVDLTFDYSVVVN